jgi:hypothetical protein
VKPIITPYPPGLAHDKHPAAAVDRESCIVHTAEAQIALTPDQADYSHWLKEYDAYHDRQTSKQLRSAFCRIEVIGGREALASHLEDAPLMSRKDWEDAQLNVMGRILREETADRLAERIANLS